MGCGESTAVTWSVLEGASGGSVDASGKYTAPMSPGTYHVKATAQADPSKSATAAVSVQQGEILVEQAVQPSASSRTIEADGGAVALEIPGGLFSAPVSVRIEKVTGIPSPPEGITLKSPWYRITVDGNPPPMGTAVLFRDIPTPPSEGIESGEALEDITSGGLTYRAPDFHDIPTQQQPGVMTTWQSDCPVYAATWKVRPVRQTWDAKPHFTIYYYTTGDDAVPTDYQAENHADPAVPDFVEDVGAFLERAYDRYVAASPGGMGLKAPYTAESKGQVYIGNYSTSEWSKYTGYIYIANKFNSKAELGANWVAVNGQDKTLLQWEMAHELFHAVQNQYRTIAGMGSVLWLTESLCDYAAHVVTPDSQNLMDVHLVNYGNWLSYQYWNSSSGDQTKYMGAGFFDYEAERFPTGFEITSYYMEKEYTAAYSQAGALDNLLDRHLYLKVRFPEWIEYFYFSETSPLARTYFPQTKRVPKAAYRFRNGTTGCPAPANRYAYEKDKLENKIFTLGGSGGLLPWTGDYIAVFPNGDSGLPTSDKVWKYQVAMKTDLNANEVAKLFLSKNGRIIGPGQTMPAKGTKIDVELGKTKAADAFYVFVVNPNPSGSPATAHQVEVTPSLAITNANGYNQTWPYLFCAGTPVKFQVAVIGGSPPLQFSIVDGALPSECSMNTSTGLITGDISGDSSSFHNFRVQVKDSHNETVTGDFSVMACRNTDTFVCNLCWYAGDSGAGSGTSSVESAPSGPLAAGLSLGQGSGAPGDKVEIPVTLSGGGSIPCALSMDISYDTQALYFEGVEAGPAGTAAGKQTISNIPKPGVVRVAIYGLNQTPVQDGTVAKLTFSISTGASSDQLLGATCSAADAAGGDLTTSCGGGSISVTACDLTCTATAAPTSGSPPLAVAFTASASGANCADIKFEWDFGDGSTLSNLQNPAHTYTSQGSYTWTMTATGQGNRSCTRQGTIEVGSGCTGPLVTVHPRSQSVQSGQSASLSVTATGSAPISYQWYRGPSGDTSAPVGGNSPAFTTPPLVATTAYWVRVSNGCGRADSDAATITVQSGCTLTCDAAASPASGSAPLSVTFSASATPVGCAGIREAGAVTDLASGEAVSGSVEEDGWALYRIAVPSDAAQLEVKMADTTADLDLYVRYSAVPDLVAWDYRPWLPGGDETVIVTKDSSPAPLRAGDWYIGIYGFRSGGFTIRAKYGDPAGTTVLTSGVPYPDSLQESEWKYYRIDVPQSATELTINTAEATADMDLYVRFGSIPDYDNWDYRPYTLNGNETVTVTPSSSPRPLQQGTWFAAVHSFWTGSYTITATFKGGGTCVLSCTATVPSTGTAGSAVSFASTASAAGCGASPSYAWTFGDGATSSQQNPSHTYTSPGTYPWSLAVTAGAETCTRGGTVIISSAPACSVNCSATVPGFGTAGQPVSFSSAAAASNCSGPVTYSWTFGDGATSSEQNPVHTYSSAGSFSWSLTASSQGVNCTKSGSIVVTPGDGVTYSWSFGDGATSASQNASHTYLSNGNYTWTLTASWSGKTCAKTGTVNVGSGGKPGDCDGSGTVSIGEVQKAINMFLGAAAPDCGVDCDGNGQVSIGELQKVINAFLGLASSCS